MPCMGLPSVKVVSQPCDLGRLPHLDSFEDHSFMWVSMCAMLQDKGLK